MVLTVDSWNIADARIQGIALHPLVGAYELRFGLMINVSAVADGEDRRAVIDGARVQVATGGGRARGFTVRPRHPAAGSRTIWPAL